MRETVLFNERYCAVEVDRNGLISGYNKNAESVLSDLLKLKGPEELNGLSIFKLAGQEKSGTYNSAVPEKIISSINNIRLIDAVFYGETESVIVRFILNNEVLSSLFKLIKFSSSLYLELDGKLNIQFASELFLKKVKMEKSVLYGSGISIFADDDAAEKINSSVDICKNSVSGWMKIDDIRFSFGGMVYVYEMEIYSLNDCQGRYSGVLCHFSDRSLEKKCKMMSRTIRRMSAVANFAGGIAHDYNNALTAVLGNISLAKMDAEKGSELEELLNDAESAGLKIKNLTERLSMFARGMKPSKEKTDIKTLIEGFLPEMFCDYKGRYSIKIQDNMAKPEIDQELISEAIMHVVENAIDAVNRPDGEIAVEAEEAEISRQSIFRETSLISGRYIIVSVKDNGSGIDPLGSNEIFDPYITTKEGREGLGLALAYTVLKRHRGFISAENSELGGADFKIYIPLF